jgi:MFS family permease
MNRQIATIVMVVIMSITTALVPYSQSLWNLYLIIWLYGFGCGAWNSAVNVWLIEIWLQKSAPILLLSQFMYGIGTIFGPLLDKPYLTGEQISHLNVTNISSATLFSMNNMTNAVENIDRRCKLKTPFLISGIIQIIGI